MDAMSIYYLYAPPAPYVTTSVSRSFPEPHYWPLENAIHNTLHKIGHSVQDVVHPYGNEVRTPHADIRETVDKFYIDVELPGLGGKTDPADFCLKWTNSRTLFLEAELKQPEISVQTTSEEAAKKPEVNGETPHHPIHLTTKERRLGHYARAFNFWVEVDREAMETKLQYGLLQIVLKKVPEEKTEHKVVNVEEHHDL